MALTIRDIADAGLTLELRCRDCRRVVQLPPSLMLRRFRHDTLFLLVIGKLRCGQDGMLPDVRLVLKRPEVDHEALRRRLSIHER